MWRSSLLSFIVLLIVYAAGCHPAIHLMKEESGKDHTPTQDPNGYAWRGYRERVGDEWHELPNEDTKCLREYSTSNSKGKWSQDRRISILTDHLTAKVGETIKIFHVFEDRSIGQELYIMGPKLVYGVWTDGKCTSAVPEGLAEYPFTLIYDGRTLPSPGWDYNFAFTTVSFNAIGKHEVVWKIGDLESNQLSISIVE